MMLQREVGTIHPYVICQFCVPDFLTSCRRPSLDDAKKIQTFIFTGCKLLLLHVLCARFSHSHRSNEFVQLGLGQRTRQSDK